MQGQRGKMVSLPETFEIDRASSSSGASLDQQLFWNDVIGTPETHFSGFVLPPNESRLPCLNSTSHEQRNVGGWGSGEASSGSVPYRSSNSDWKVENGWASAVGRHGPRIEDQQRLGPSSTVLSLDNTSTNAVFVQGSGSNSMPPNFTSNGEYVGPSGESPSLAQYTNLYKSSGSSNNLRYPMPPANQVDPLFPLGSGGYVGEESEVVGSGGSLDRRRVPCKRKSFEGHVGQSSHIENSNFPQPMESSSSPWVATPPCFNMSGGPATHTIPEQVGPRLALELAGATVGRSLVGTESAHVAHRNFRLRVNSSGQNDPRPTSLSSSVVAASGSPSVTSAVQSSSRLVPPNRSLELPPPVASTGSVRQGLHPFLQVPGVRAPDRHTVGWSRGPIQRNNGSSSHPILPDDASSSGNSRNMSQRPGLVPNLSSSARGFVSASSSGFPGTADSAALGSSSSAAPQLPHHSSAPQPNHHHPRNLRRLSDYVSSQLLSSGSDFRGGQTSNAPNSSGRPVLPDVLLPSRPGSSGHRASSSRPGVWMERQGDSVVGIPYPMRTLAAGSEGRRRLPSELRRMLELVRRGEGGFRDVMILDPSMFFADMHDRHRDMRLDVDNMSYEELLALEERIGNVNTGLNEETIFARMKQRKHSDMAITHMDAEPCCICQEEYKNGEDIGSLDCGHDFHRDCIKQWLTQKNLCPICKTTGLKT